MQRRRITQHLKNMLRLLLTTALSSFVISATAQGPSASFVQDISSSCIPLTVSFTSTSTNASTYYWDFGNGNTSTLESPTNVYVNAGIYDVKLIATNSGGVSDTLIMVGAATAVDQPVAGYYA
ncbi:MAG TPA: PKD domain-containing protein, partial [Flavobacteriales bacterium]|nr:PKD domain-containing protein [Flavobacteriales bacterium]